VEEGVFFEPDVHKHRFEAVFDVFDAALEYGTDDVAVGLTFDGVFLQHAVFKERHAAFEFFGTNDEGVSGSPRGETEKTFDTFGHGKKFRQKG
jgi:hypothetical protein